MKPKEFDELIRQKFDQNDFAYKSGSWDSLAEQLEGRAKKRSVIMWWWVPLAGMAASVALAMGSSSLMQHSVPAVISVNTEVAQTYRSARPSAGNADGQIIPPAASSHKEAVYAATCNSNSNTKAGKSHDGNVSDWFHVRLNDAALASWKEQNSRFDLLAADNKVQPKNKKEPVIVREGYTTFKEDEETVKKLPTFSITLLGGYNQGSVSTGYMAGGTVRKMLSDKLYIESDIAFASSNNSQLTGVPIPSHGVATSARHTEARTTTVDASKPNSITGPVQPTSKTVDESYNLNYAQVSPSIGYKILKRVAIGVGPDFQQALMDNRPAAPASDYRGNIQVAPLFDVGLMGKTEYAITKRLKAGVSYRKGMNNFINPNLDKYIDRDYLQFQIRCTIFNK